jgi:cytochrome c oxidase assembly factor CtaG
VDQLGSGRRRSRGVLVERCLLPIACCLLPTVVLAHDGHPPAPHDLSSAWAWEPTIVLGLALTAWVYARGVRTLWKRAGPGHGIRRWQAAVFGAGLATLFIALISPLDALGSALFSAHMVQHLLLIAVAAPLLVVGAPLAPLLWGLPDGARRAVGGRWRLRRWVRAGWRALTDPLVVWALNAVALWVWHLPGLYQAALRSEAVHTFEHGSFLATALLFWWTVAHCRARGRLSQGAGVLYLFTAAMQGGILGALMTFTPRPWYPIYESSVAAWGLTPLEDQQLAGLIMWIPSGLIYALGALVLLAAWLHAAERVERRSA